MKAPEVTKTHFALDGSQVKRVPMDFAEANLPSLMKKLGFGFDPGVAREMYRMYAMDAVDFGMDSIQGNVTSPAIPGLVQFLQYWLPGQVYVMTAIRQADELMGIQTQGEFSDEQIVQEMLENTGYPRPYSDNGNVPLADFNITFPERTNVRFELGMRVGTLEEERNARIRVNAGQAKRESCGLNLEITRNLVGFNGYNGGNNNTYGFLNDPGLLPYNTVANGASGNPEWSTKTFLEIQQDFLAAFSQLITQSQGNIDASKVPVVVGVATNAYVNLTKTSDFGISVKKWLEENYKVRIVQAPQLNNANGSGLGAGGFYIYPERVNDLSTDDGRVWLQVVPQKFRVLGVQKLVKSWEEGYANATAGAMCKRPWAVTRWSGIS